MHECGMLRLLTLTHARLYSHYPLLKSTPRCLTTHSANCNTYSYCSYRKPYTPSRSCPSSHRYVFLALSYLLVHLAPSTAPHLVGFPHARSNAGSVEIGNSIQTRLKPPGAATGVAFVGGFDKAEDFIMDDTVALLKRDESGTCASGMLAVLYK